MNHILSEHKWTKLEKLEELEDVNAGEPSSFTYEHTKNHILSEHKWTK